MGSEDDKLRTTLRIRLVGLAVVAAALILVFWEPIWKLARFSFSNDLFTYIPLIAPASFFLIWSNRRNLRPNSRPARGYALLFGLAGLALLGAYAWGRQAGWNPDISDYLAIMTAAFLLVLGEHAVFFSGAATIRARSHSPWLFDFRSSSAVGPASLDRAFLQYASADTAYSACSALDHPGVSRKVGSPAAAFGSIKEVAARNAAEFIPTLVLFVTSTLAGHMFLGTTWRRILLTASVLPLALLRNGFRIFVIGQEACVTWDHK